MKLFAQAISAISNPLVVSVPMSFALVFKSSGSLVYATQWTLISLVFASFLGMFVLVGVRLGLFSNLDVSIRSQRPPIFIFAGFISLFYIMAVVLLSGPKILILSGLALLLGILLESIINRSIKASVHLAVYSAFCLIVGILYGGLFWLFVILIPLVAWSRIVLRRHVVEETVIGTILGILLVLLLYLVIQYFY